MFLQQLINGLALGSIYALIAIGYSLVFGVLKLVNFANGSIYMLGGFLSLVLFNKFQSSFLLCFALALIINGLVGFCLDFFALRRLRKTNATRLVGLITTMGFGTVIDNFVMLFFSNATVPYPNIINFGSFRIGNAIISSTQIIIFLSVVLILLLMSFLVYGTKIGKAMRATSQNADAARLMGVNVNGVISMTFILSAILAGVSGTLVGMYYQMIDFTSGFSIGMKTMAAAVLGGVGSLPGAVAGGLIIGIVESLGAAYISSAYRNAFAFIVLIIVVLFLPNGLFGKEKISKV
ncbi:MAG: branched-chain amino acid ABC transporter permease [Lachnospiraceae bacterium]|nr:branched-chain amino acid ABC transporter permease [Lachnospiraceae bacterium]